MIGVIVGATMAFAIVLDRIHDTLKEIRNILKGKK